MGVSHNFVHPVTKFLQVNEVTAGKCVLDIRQWSTEEYLLEQNVWNKFADPGEWFVGERQGLPVAEVCNSKDVLSVFPVGGVEGADEEVCERLVLLAGCHP